MMSEMKMIMVMMCNVYVIIKNYLPGSVVTIRKAVAIRDSGNSLRFILDIYSSCLVVNTPPDLAVMPQELDSSTSGADCPSVNVFDQAVNTPLTADTSSAS